MSAGALPYLLADPSALLVSLVVVPILDVACQVATVMASGMTMDREEGIIPQILARRPMDLAYWIGLGLPGVMAASVTGLVALAGTLVLNVGHCPSDFLRALSLLPAALFACLSLGLLLGWPWPADCGFLRPSECGHRPPPGGCGCGRAY